MPVGVAQLLVAQVGAGPPGAAGDAAGRSPCTAVVGSLIAADKRLDGDVDQDAQGEGRILLHRALAAERDRAAQQPVVDGGGAAVQPEQRLVDREEVADAAARTR